MGLCTPALIALVPGLFALVGLVIMAYMVGGLLGAAGALVFFGALFSIQPAILNEACKAGYANLAWMSVLATAVTSIAAAYGTYHVATAGREGYLGGGTDHGGAGGSEWVNTGDELGA